MKGTTRWGILRLGGLLSIPALILAACSAPSESEPDPNQPVDLTMVTWTNNEGMIETFQTLAEEFRQDNPELGTLTIETVAFDEYTAQIAIRLNGGDVPDLGWVYEAALPAFIDSGTLADISVIKDDAEYNFADTIPGLYAKAEVGDALYAYPFSSTTHPIVFNKTAFEAAGVDSPLDLYDRGEWTWDNLKRVSRELVESGVVTYGFDIPQFAFTNYSQMTTILKGFGAEAYPGGTECGYDSPASIAAFEFLHSMVFEDQSFPGLGVTSSFPTGDTGLYMGPPSTVGQLADSDFEYDLVPQPNGVNGLDPFLGQGLVSVFKDGDNVDLSTRLLMYFTSEHGASELEKYNVPSRAALLTPEKVAQINPLLTPEAAERALVGPLSVAKQLDYPVAFPELESATRPLLDNVWQPDADIPAVLQTVCEAADPILANQG